MTPNDRIFLRDFFRQVSDQPIGPEDPRYIHLYDDSELTGADPVELMARAIEWTPGQSVQLLSGYRGTGKSSELKRLEQHLRDNGYLVIRCDIERVPQPFVTRRHKRFLDGDFRIVQRCH